MHKFPVGQMDIMEEELSWAIMQATKKRYSSNKRLWEYAWSEYEGEWEEEYLEWTFHENLGFHQES